MKKSNDTIGNRTRHLPTCSAVPRPTALPRTPFNKIVLRLNHNSLLHYHQLHVSACNKAIVSRNIQLSLLPSALQSTVGFGFLNQVI